MTEHSVGSPHSAGESENQNHRSQRRREAHLPQPVRRIKSQPMPEMALLGGFQRFLQPHARSRQQIGRRLSRRSLRQQRVKLLLRLQFSGAIRAAFHMLLQFMPGIIRQLAINMQRNIFPHPFAFHSNPVSRFQVSKFQGL